MDVTAQICSNIADGSQNESQYDESEETTGIKFKDWGFKVDRLFEVALRFYKRNESKAFHPTFDERNQMNALILQAKYGNFNGGKAPDIGVLDLVGKNRRHQWSLLKDMSKMEAMSKFICNLDSICPLFKAHAEAVKLSTGIQIEWDNDKNGAGTSSAGQGDTNEQLKAIRTSLSRQTYDQFKSYAMKQYPNDLNKQKYLISTLQEQYFQQYISQMLSEAAVTNNNNINNNTNSLDIINNGGEIDASERECDLSSPTPEPPHSSKLSETSSTETLESETPLEHNISYGALEPATIWTKKGVREFKDSLIDDKHGGVHTVKQGTLLTIQVPTYPDGKYIYWEFVTEEYDIGFGLSFIYEDNLEKPLAMKFYEDSDEDGDDDGITIDADDNVNKSNGYTEESTTSSDTSANKLAHQRANSLPVVPVYRRDSHEEVYVGRHRYPGRGYYLLKFDNTYSVLRSKSLFFRICHFI